ncbi:MAG: ABC transporter ATP-binding protein [Candidatus Pacebacteria bacterium]|nr:ABC transporter ATP-binding protein [Candidatus Paceibacterota bacterium]
MIEALNLVKWFGPILAVNDVTFTVERGEVLGFLGPNGAGKSTTMRMITGFLPPSSGTVRIDGHDVVDDPIPARENVGYLPENAPGYPEMTVTGFLNFVAEVHGLGGQDKRDAVGRVVEMCHLRPVLHQPIDTLSKGYRHRTCFAQSILPDPPILVLDEPTDGLDPNQKREVRDLIREMGKEKAIILSTHILEEVDAVCSRVIIIDNGQLVCNGTPDELRKRAPGAGSVTVGIYDHKAGEIKDVFSGLKGVKRVDVLGEHNGAVQVKVYPVRQDGNPLELGPVLANVMKERGMVFGEFHTEKGRLEEVFYDVTRAEQEVASDTEKVSNNVG